MKAVYLDNAATTSLDPLVLEKMLPYLQEYYGNPSSIYSLGRATRLAIEEARKTVAQLLGAKTSELFFTSCGTESSNTVLKCAIEELGCTRIISSKIEHPATLKTIESLKKIRGITVEYVNLYPDGKIDYAHLEELLQSSDAKTLVSLMHANNEIAHLLDISRTASLCKSYNAYFHSDMVQTVGHYPINLSELGVDFISASAHKFHGPKGSGLLFISSSVKLNPLILGGGQERNMRAGTENVANIVGFAEALKLACNHMEQDSLYIKSLRDTCLQKLQNELKIPFSLNSSLDGLYTLLNISLDKTDRTEALQMSLDMKGICVSGGSACSSGAATGSHVIEAIRQEENVPLRISFSKLNTLNDIDYLITTLGELLN